MEQSNEVKELTAFHIHDGRLCVSITVSFMGLAFEDEICIWLLANLFAVRDYTKFSRLASYCTESYVGRDLRYFDIALTIFISRF